MSLTLQICGLHRAANDGGAFCNFYQPTAWPSLRKSDPDQPSRPDRREPAVGLPPRNCQLLSKMVMRCAVKVLLAASYMPSAVHRSAVVGPSRSAASAASKSAKEPKLRVSRPCCPVIENSVMPEPAPMMDTSVAS